MNLLRHHNKRRQAGFTILEVLVAGLITGILAMSSFQFYVSMHNQTLTQEEVSDMQTNCRASLHEIGQTLRMGGYKLSDTHNPFEITGDSLYDSRSIRFCISCRSSVTRSTPRAIRDRQA